MRTIPSLFPLVATILLVSPLSACSGGAEHVVTEDAVFPAGIERIELDVEAGDIVIRGADVEVISGVRTQRWNGNAEPELGTTVEGSVLTLIASCPKMIGCNVDYDLEVPRGVEVVLGLGSGDANISGVSGEVVGDVGSGDLVMRELAGPLSVVTGSGDVTLDGLLGDVDVETGSGDVFGVGLSGSLLAVEVGSGDVEIEAAAESVNDVTVHTGSGDVVLTVASGVWDVSVDTGSGDVAQTGISSDKGADRSLTVNTGRGDVTLIGD